MRILSRDIALLERSWTARILGALTAFGVAGPCLPALIRADNTQPINLAFAFPISTNQDPTVATHFRLGILYGRVGAIRGADVSGIVGRVDGEFRGVQLTGVHSWVGGEFRGVAVTGGILFTGGESHAVQFAGLGNFDRGRFSGAQFGGLFNMAESGFHGIQLSSLYNLSSGDSRYVQLSSVVNATSGSFRGIQASGLLNFTNGPLTGVQVGLMGAADSLTGVQAGLVNTARVVHGTQIGVVNLSRRIDGVPIGMVNWTRDGGKEWDTYASSYAGLSTGLRTTVSHIYSVVAAGLGDLDQEASDTFFFAWHLGREFPITRIWDVDLDTGFVHVVPQPNDDPTVNDRLHFAVQARVTAAVELSRRSALYFGGGWNGIFSEYSSKASPDHQALGVLGYRFH